MSFPRYPKYKKSGVAWLGEVPAHWELLPLKSLASERDESNVGMTEENLLSLSYGRIVRKDATSNDGLLPESFETYQIVWPGDIVLRLTDLQNDKRSLRSALVEEVGIITSAYVAVTPRRIHPRYLNFLLRAYDITKVFYSMGGGLRQSMKFSDLKRLGTLLPPQTEQAAIAGFLDGETAKIDALVAEQQRLIGLLKEKRRSVIARAVTKGLNPDAPLKPSGIEWLGDVPTHWEMRRLKFVSRFLTSGPRGWSERVSEQGSHFVQSGDLDDELRVNFSSCKRVHVVDDAEAARTLLHSGDVLVCITGAKTGNVAICVAVPEAAYVNQHLCLIRPTADILAVFLGASLKAGPGQTHFELAQYGLKQGLSLDDVRETPVAVPPVTEQAAISEYVTAKAAEFETLTAEAERAIALLQERRSALISAAVTGKIDVRGLVDAEAA